MRTRLIHTKPECRDPVSIGIAIISAFESVSGLAIGFEAASAIGYVAVGGLLVGAQYAINKLAARTPGPGGGGFGLGINAPDVHGNIQQSAPPQRILYGKSRIGGAVFFLNTDTPPFCYLGLLLSARRINRVVGLHIGTNDIVFPSIPANNTIGQPVPIAGQIYISGTSRLFYCFRDGRDTQTIDALLQANFGALDTNFRQQGIATATFKFSYGASQSEFQQMWGNNVAIPNPLMDVEGALVYDPRDATQNIDDDTTWKYSNNAALVQADWLHQPYGINLRTDQLRLDEIADAANFDDQLVGNADGTFSKRHTIDGVVQFDQSPRTVMEAMLTANRGFVVQSKGKGWVSSSQSRTPVLTIDDAILMAGFEFRDDKALADTVNVVRSRFSSSDREYQDIDGPVLTDAAAIAADNEELDVTIKLPFTSDYRAVERLAKQYKEEARLPRALTCTVKLRALGLEIGDCVRVYTRIAAFQRMNGFYSVQQLGFLDDFSGMNLSLTEYDPTIADNWVASVDETPFTLPNVGVAA